MFSIIVVWRTTLAPPTPTVVTAEVMNVSSVRVAWQWTRSGPAPACFNNTHVIYNPEGERESSLLLRDPTATEAILTDLQNNTCYIITVVATAGEHRREGAAFLLVHGMLLVTVCFVCFLFVCLFVCFLLKYIPIYYDMQLISPSDA